MEPLLWDTSIQGTRPFRGTQNLVRKNVHIIFAFVASIEGPPLFKGKEHFLWVPNHGFNLHLGDTSIEGTLALVPRVSPEWRFHCIFTVIAKFQLIIPFTEQIGDNIQPVPRFGNLELRKGRLRKLWSKQKKEIEVNLCQGFVSCGSLFRTLCRWVVGGGGRSLWFSFQ